MRIHANARTCPNSRKLLVQRIEEENWSLMAAAGAKRAKHVFSTSLATSKPECSLLCYWWPAAPWLRADRLF